MPLHLGHHSLRADPTPHLMLEVVIADYGPLGWPLHRALQQMLDLSLKDIFAGKPNGVDRATLPLSAF